MANGRVVNKTSLIEILKGFLKYVPKVDNVLSNTSTNAIQNKAVKEGLDGKLDVMYLGGDNLLLEDSFTAGSTNTAISARKVIISPSNQDTFFYFSTNKVLELGKKYILSFDASGLLDGTFIAFSVGEQKSLQRFTMNSNGRNFVIFIGDSFTTTSTRIILDDYSRTFVDGQGDITLSNFKLERVDVPDYTPSFQDKVDKDDFGMTIVTDWNKALKTGFYKDVTTSSLNSPIRGVQFVGQVLQWSENNVIQVLNKWGSTSYGAYSKYQRVINPVSGVYGAWTNITPILSTELATKSDVGHTHGLGNSNFVKVNNSTNLQNTWNDVFDNPISRAGLTVWSNNTTTTSAFSPFRYSSTLAFGATDTKGFLGISQSESSPLFRVGGGATNSNTNNVWYFDIKGANTKTYDLEKFTQVNASGHLVLPNGGEFWIE